MNDLRPEAISADPAEHGKSVQLCHRLLKSLIARGLSLPALVEAVEKIKKDERGKTMDIEVTPAAWLAGLATKLNESQKLRAGSGRAGKEYRVYEDENDGFLYVAQQGPLRAGTIAVACGPHSGWHFDSLGHISKAERRARKAAK